MEPFPDLTQPETAFVLYPPTGLTDYVTVQVDDLYMGVLDLEDLVEVVREAVVITAEDTARESGHDRHQHVLLDLPCTFFMLRTLR